MLTRTLGRSGIQVSAIGLGCWAIGGPFWHDGWVAYGDVDDEESTRAIHRALDLGVTFFDTADAYGCGHSERVLGQALAGQRDSCTDRSRTGCARSRYHRRHPGARPPGRGAGGEPLALRLRG